MDNETFSIKGFTPTSVIDFPGKISSIVFTPGCNFRCPFCHNSALVLRPETLPDYDPQHILNEISRRVDFQCGLVITGGEPFLQKGLHNFVEKAKSAGVSVKIDTNGSFPERLKECIRGRLVDYVAMDIKNEPSRYSLSSGVEIDFALIEESIRLLSESKLHFELRTTVTPGLIREVDMAKIRGMIPENAVYYLQQYQAGHTIDPRYEEVEPYDLPTLYRMRDLLSTSGVKVYVRF